MRRVNGRAIEDYKDFEVRETGLAVPKAEPLYLPAISNGIAPHDFIVDESLVLYLPLYLLKGSKFKSVDRYAHTCTVIGALWRPNGRLYTGDDDYISVPYDAAFAITTAITIIAWAYIENYPINLDYDIVLDRLGNYALTCYDDDGRIGLYLNTAGGWQFTTTGQGIFTLDGWGCYGATWDGSNRRFYKDGTKIATIADTGTMTSSTTDIAIGMLSDLTSFPFDGRIGEVWLCNRAFSDAEMDHICKATKWRYQ